MDGSKASPYFRNRLEYNFKFSEFYRTNFYHRWKKNLIITDLMCLNEYLWKVIYSFSAFRQETYYQLCKKRFCLFYQSNYALHQNLVIQR
jgi:hypothetical protein